MCAFKPLQILRPLYKMLRISATSAYYPFIMPRPRYDVVPESDTEIIEEVTTRHRTKRGMKLKQERGPIEQPVQTKQTKASGSRSKTKKQAQAHQAADKIPDAGDTTIMQTYDFVGDEEFPLDHLSEVEDHHAKVSLQYSLFMFYVSDISQSPMDQWLQCRSTYLHMLLEMEGRVSSLKCSICSKGSAHIKCSDCFGGNIFCKDCCLRHHRRSPFHRLLEWNGRHYAPKSLYSLGFILFLGHNGDPCPKTVEVCSSRMYFQYLILHNYFRERMQQGQHLLESVGPMTTSNLH